MEDAVKRFVWPALKTLIAVVVAVALVDADAVHAVATAVADAYRREGFNPPAFLDAVPAAPAGRLA